MPLAQNSVGESMFRIAVGVTPGASALGLHNLRRVHRAAPSLSGQLHLASEWSHAGVPVFFVENVECRV